MKDTPYLYKRPGAVNAARLANHKLAVAMEVVNAAEGLLNAAGYRAAGHGVHQARMRLESWREKVRAAIAQREAVERRK